MLKQIRKEDIPKWELGDVTIKTFSFGEKLELGNLKAKMKDGTPQVTDAEISIKDVSIKGLAAGIHFIRTVEGTQFIIKPGTPLADREKVVYDVAYEAGEYLLKEIWEINKEISKEEIKN